MKNFILLLIIPLLNFGQSNIDTINQYSKINLLTSKIELLETDIEIMRNNMAAHYKNYVIGTVLSIAGPIVSLVFADKEAGPYIGLGISIGGGLITFDSHKWFSKKFTKRIPDDPFILKKRKNTHIPISSKKTQSYETELDLLCNCYLLMKSDEMQNQSKDILNSCQKLFVRYQLNTKEGKNQIEQILENRGCFK